MRAETLLILAVLGTAACADPEPAGRGEAEPRVERDVGARDEFAQLRLTFPNPAGREALEEWQSDAVPSYVRDVFVATVGELPRLGWITADGRLLSYEQHPAIELYGPAGLPLGAAFAALVPADSADALRRSEWIACDDAGAVLAAYPLATRAPFTGFNRALFTTQPWPNRVPRDLTTRRLTPAELQTVSVLLRWPVDGVRRDRIHSIGTDVPHYSVHALFDADSVLVEEALVLHAPDGSILGYETIAVDADEVLCDGCTTPVGLDETSFFYDVEQMFELGGFAYPVLLLNTSTADGRALSLLTFRPDGVVSTYRVYEYVMNCGVPLHEHG